ncbi:hypothetical protein [Roseibium sp.]|uniref:hypothetical protein n=1 Tax=Roseibium sp. TaxID=1936156 RepID=UPI003A97448C
MKNQEGIELRDATLDESLRFDCLVNSRYHEDREAHYSRIHRFLMFFIVVSGAAAISQVLESVPYAAETSTAMAAVAGLIDLVFGVSEKAKQHAMLRWRVLSILADLEAKEVDVQTLRHKLAAIFADEPPTMYTVQALAENGAIRAMGMDQRKLYKISAWRKALRHWIRFEVKMPDHA